MRDTQNLGGATMTKQMTKTKGNKLVAKKNNAMVPTTTEVTQEIRELQGLMKGDRKLWEPALVDLQKEPTIDNLKKFYEAVGKDRLAAMRKYHSDFIKGNGRWETPEKALATVPKGMAELMYTATWPTFRADELTFIAGKYIPSFEVLYKAFSVGGCLRPEKSRPAASFIAAKIGWAIIQGF